jgi:hypothetical protein
MINLLSNQAEAYSRESFECGDCGQQFETKVITWIDTSKTPQAKQALLKWQFNIIQCTHCGCRHFSGTPFFFEDFEEGLLVAVFPAIPDKRGEVEKSIRKKYGYYPLLEFFYDMTQIWMLLYFQEHYKTNKNLRKLSRLGEGEKRIRTILRFLKQNPLMIDIREKLTETFFGNTGEDELLEILGRAVYLLEEMLPWPRDGHCICGSNLAKDFVCCEKNLNLAEHEHLLSQHYVIYCPTCKEALSGASCEHCGRVYTWKLGTVESYQHDADMKPRTSSSSSHSRSNPSSHLNKSLS